MEIEELGKDKRTAKVAHASPDDPKSPAPPTPVGAHPTNNSSVDFDISDMPVVELKRGTWVEFLHDGGQRIRAKLSWISPLKGVYLFTNPGATEALSVAPEALQVQFHRGDAKVIEESSLIDRAVDKMVNSLSRVAHT